MTDVALFCYSCNAVGNIGSCCPDAPGSVALVPVGFANGVARQTGKLHDAIESLRRELENERARGIHTCHDRCDRQMCVLRRERDALAAELRALREQEPVAWVGLDCDGNYVEDDVRYTPPPVRSAFGWKPVYAAPVPSDARDTKCDALVNACKALEDFASTVAPSSSWWDDVWPEHEAAILAAKKGGAT